MKELDDIECFQTYLELKRDQLFTYIYNVKQHHLKLEKPRTDKTSEKEHVERVEEIYRQTERYEDAIKQFNEEMGREIYKNYSSFKAARYRVRNPKR